MTTTGHRLEPDSVTEGLTASVIGVGEMGPAALESWRSWQYQTPGLDSPFLSPDFARAIDRIRPGCQVLSLRDGLGDGGFLAFEATGRGRARSIGMGVSDTQGLVLRPGVVSTVAPVLAAASLSVFEFDHLVAGQAPTASPDARTFGSPTMDLSQGYATYRADRRGLTKSAIASVERKDRKLERERGEVRLEYDNPDPELLELMMTWKSAHYRRTGAPDLFRNEWSRALLLDCLATRTPRYAGLLSTLFVADVPVAIEFGLRSATQYERWFGGYDGALGAYSPGLVTLLRFAEAAAEDGLQRIDLGKGSEPYKDYFASHHQMLSEGWVSRPSVAAAAHRARHAPPRAARAFLKRHPELRRRYRSGADAVNRVRRYGLTTDPIQED